MRIILQIIFITEYKSSTIYVLIRTSWIKKILKKFFFSIFHFMDICTEISAWYEWYLYVVMMCPKVEYSSSSHRLCIWWQPVIGNKNTFSFFCAQTSSCCPVEFVVVVSFMGELIAVGWCFWRLACWITSSSSVWRLLFVTIVLLVVHW